MQGAYIFVNIILPIFLQIGAGYVLKKIIDFDLKTLAVVQLYIIIPALMFVKICEAQMNGNVLFLILVHTLLLFGILCGIGAVVVRIGKMRKSESGAFINSIAYYNTGNYSIPLVELLYGGGIAMTVQVFIMTIHNVLFNLFGVLIGCSGKQSIKQSLMEMLKIPMLYSAVIAIILRISHTTVPEPIWHAVDSLGSALVPTALISLGAQLAVTRFRLMEWKVLVSAFLRLLISPAISLGLVYTLGITGELAQLLVISAATPTATNIALLAIQYNTESEFVAQTIFGSTLFSTVTVTLVILAAQAIL